MSRPQGEDDGSVLKYVTEDELQRARQIAHYTILKGRIRNSDTAFQLIRVLYQLKT